MGEGFSDRLRDAMLANGITATPPELARVCKVSRQTAANWLAMREPGMRAKDLIRVADCLNVRMRWLADGRGVMRVSEHFDRAARIMAAMPAGELERWLREGERLAHI